MMSVRKAVVIGYGSIGQRHIRLLNSLGIATVVVSKHQIDVEKSYSTIEEAIESEYPEYIVVANETYLHEEMLTRIQDTGYDQRILVEKPLFAKMTSKNYHFSSLYVGYNLRFHPIIQKLFELLKSEQIISVNAYVGQYLPTWRPNTDYTKGYSADVTKGGGVIRDLSHELDYLNFLFGNWAEMTASGGQISDLSIQSDDYFSVLYQTQTGINVSVEMNYLDRIIQRQLVIQTNEHTFKADLIGQKIQIDSEIIRFKVDRDETYLNQHIALLNNHVDMLCDLQGGLDIVRMIEVAEQCSKEKVWIKNA
ncbi:Gfo/Idh/MocA family protein [Lysinibacillus parviboronicapiens]|uniref:Gfo/Idh/MocA family protein n=1 Tax=Lysinibacillus parviboronicapiens TaxID=436516 RepID=UPI000D3C6826|nr:Gfo/Idh/MocA family oxidoreductase [Lysinibacillus parviboronicapiens]